MLKTVLITLLIAFIAIEILEHVIVPLAWVLLRRSKRGVGGAEALLGQVAEVRQWEKGRGLVFIKGELWEASSEASLAVGEKAVVKSVDGLVLKVRPMVDDRRPPGGG